MVERRGSWVVVAVGRTDGYVRVVVVVVNVVFGHF